MKYQIHYMPGQEFDRLPYKGAKDALGLADPTSGRAYVRDTGMPMMDRFTAEHEMQELIAQTSPHEEDGIRYKKGGALRNILPTVLGGIASFLMPAAAPAIWTTLAGVGTGMASNIGMQQYAKSNHPEQLGEPGGLGLLSDAGWGALAGYGGGAMGSGAAKAVRGLAPNATLGAKIGAGLKGAVGFGGTQGATKVATTEGAKLAGAAGTSGNLASKVAPVAASSGSKLSGALGSSSNLATKVMSGGSPIASGAAQVANSTVPALTGSLSSGLLSAFKPNTGGAIGAVKNLQTISNKMDQSLGGQVVKGVGGQLMTPPQSSPAPTVGAWSSGTQGQGSSSPFVNMPSNFTNQEISEQDLQDAYNKIDANALQNTTGIMNQFRGQTIAGNSQYAKSIANMQRGVTTAKEQAATQLQSKADAKYNYDYIMKQNNLDDARMKNLVALVNQPDSVISRYVGNDPAEFRRVFSQFA